MSLLSATVFLTLAASAPEPVLIAPYQSLGVDASTVSAVIEGFRQAVTRDALVPMPASESDKVMRSAVMCGEDGACLATVGQRSGARWVLAFGVGKVGSSLLVSAVFVDVVAGKEIMHGDRRAPETAPDWAAVTRSLADEVVKPPAQPTVVEVPVNVPQPSHKFRAWAFASLGVTGLSVIAATIIGLGAWGHYAQLDMNPSDFDVKVREQRSLNASGDAFLVVGVVTGALTLLFFLLDKFEKPPEAVPP